MLLVAAAKAHLHWFFVEKYPPGEAAARGNEGSASTWHACMPSELGPLHAGTPEFGLLIWPIAMYWIISAFYDMLDTLDLPITRHFKVWQMDGLLQGG
jgi:hypothetical protein